MSGLTPEEVRNIWYGFHIIFVLPNVCGSRFTQVPALEVRTAVQTCWSSDARGRLLSVFVKFFSSFVCSVLRVCWWSVILHNPGLFSDMGFFLICLSTVWTQTIFRRQLLLPNSIGDIFNTYKVLLIAT